MMLLTNWLANVTSRPRKRPVFRSRDRRAFRQRWQTAIHNQLTTAEVLEDRTLLTAITASLAGGNLEIVQNTNADSTLVLSESGGVLTVSDSASTIAAPAGGTQVNENSFTIPVAQLTGGVISVIGGTGSDHLTVDTSVATAGLQVVYEGGGGAGDDSLSLIGTAVSTEFQFANLHDGNVRLNGSGESFVAYTGLEPIYSLIDTIDVTLNYSNTGETINISGATGGNTTITSTAGETVTFLNPTGTLLINTEKGDTDTINVNTLDSSFDAHLTISPDPEDTINVGTVDLGSGDLNLDGIVNFNGAFTTTGLIDIEADGNLTFAAGASASASEIILYSHMNLMLGEVIASGIVELEAVGAIIDANANSSNISAVNATLISGTGIGVGDALETSISALEADSYAGFELENTGSLVIGFAGGLNGMIIDGATRIIASNTITITEEISVEEGLLQLENTAGDFLIQNSALISNTDAFGIEIDSNGIFSMGEGTRIESGGTGLIDIQATNDILLSRLVTSGEVELTSAAGAIRDNTVAETSLISSDSAILQAATGIGGSGGLDLDTEVNSITANSTQGPIMIGNFDEPYVQLPELTDLVLFNNSPEQTVSLSGISVGGGEAQPLQVTATSSNTGLIPDPSVFYNSAESTGSLVFTPVTNQTGTATITVTVEDGSLDGNLATTADNATFIRTFDVTVRNYETVSLRVLDEPTATDANGEVESLPAELDWVSEWDSYWVEIWVSTEDLNSQGIASVLLDLSYQTGMSSATAIEYGPAFSQNQVGSINDGTGLVAGLAAETAIADLGFNTQLLFARIQFESLAQDEILLDLEGQSLGPHDPGLVLLTSEVSLHSERLNAATSVDSSETGLWANPYDLNDDDTINYRDLILFVGVYGDIPSESDSDYAWAADLDQSDRVNYRDLIIFVGNYGKGKVNDPDVNYPSNYPDAWNNLLRVSSEPQSETNSANLTQTEADQVLEKAIEQVSEKLTPEMNEALSGVEVKVVDLSGGTLGRAVPGTIYLDVNAAGYGWFVDSTPFDHSEFTVESQLSLIALPESAAAGRIDLWTVILHELGHLAGYEHEAEGVMEETLAPGVRKLAEWNQDSDLFFASVQEEAELLPF
jgi:hypothetical protein